MAARTFENDVRTPAVSALEDSLADGLLSIVYSNDFTGGKLFANLWWLN